MRKNLFSTLLILTLVVQIACTNANQAQKPSTEPMAKPKHELYQKHDAFMAAKGDSWNQNGIIEKRNIEEYQDSLGKWIKQPSIIKGLNFKFQEAAEAVDPKLINLGLFELADKNSSMYVFGVLSDEMVSKLVKDKIYHIDGEYIQTTNSLNRTLIGGHYLFGSHRFLITEIEEVTK
jgi:hypothetical protein